MNAKDTVSKGYDCFSKGDMETFFKIGRASCRERV